MYRLTDSRNVMGVVCLLFCLFISCQGGFASTESETRRFDISEGRAAKTLKKAVRQAGVKFIFSADVVRGVRTKAIRGEYTPMEAFRILLADTDLAVFQHEKSGVYLIKETGAPVDASSSTELEKLAQANENKQTVVSRLKELLVGAWAGSISAHAHGENGEPIYELSPFEVSIDAGNRLHGVNNSSSGTRIAAVVNELPFTLDILTTDYMDDFHLADPSNAIDEISNVSSGNPNTGAGGGNLIRGFNQWYALKDGFYRNGVVDKTLVDRVEVLKGPYAAIYGRGEPGGVVNFIPKMAVYGSRFGEATLQYGQNNTHRIQLEQNVAVAEKTALLVAASYFERDFDQGFSYERSRNVGAFLRHKLNDRDEFFFDFEKMMRRNNRGHGIPILRTETGTTGIYGGVALEGDQYIGLWGEDFVEKYGNINVRGPYTWGERHIEAYSVKWLHRFNDGVNLRVSYYDQEQDQPYNFASGGNNRMRVDENLDFIRWDSHAAPRHHEINEGGGGVNVDLTVDWKFGESEHTTLFTYDDTFTDKDRLDLRVTQTEASQLLNGPRTDIYRDWGNYSLATHPELYNELRRNDFTHIAVEGFFLMHRAGFFGDKLKVMLGTRYDESTSTLTDKEDPIDLSRVTHQSETVVDDFTYNLGANFNLSPRTIIYGSHATSFNPKGNFYSNGDKDPMPNESGKGSEFGIRTTVLNDAIDIGFSFYELERGNVKMENPEWDPEAINSDGYRNIPLEGDLDRNGLNPLTLAQVQAYEDGYRYSISTHIPGGLDQVNGYEFYTNGRVNENLSFRGSLGTANSEHVTNGAANLVGQEFRKVPGWTHALSAIYTFTKGSFEGMALSLSYKGQDDHRAFNNNDRRWFLRTDEMRNLMLAASYDWNSGDMNHKVAVSMANALDQEGIRLDGYLFESRNIQASYTVKY